MPRPIWTQPGGYVCKWEHFLDPEYADITRRFLKSEPSKHRKQWEFVYIIKQLELLGKLKKNNYGIGFGCGEEALVPAFANLGCKVIATDLHTEKSNSGWLDNNQHASSLEVYQKHLPRLCPAKKFQEHTSFKFVDMNSIPSTLFNRFDFAWSACALEHLGSVSAGLNFIINSAKCLEPGGVAVHTTEYIPGDVTRDNCGTVYFRRSDLLSLHNMFSSDFKVSYWCFPDKITDRNDGHYGIYWDNHFITSIGIVIQKL